MWKVFAGLESGSKSDAFVICKRLGVGFSRFGYYAARNFGGNETSAPLSQIVGISRPFFNWAGDLRECSLRTRSACSRLRVKYTGLSSSVDYLHPYRKALKILGLPMQCRVPVNFVVFRENNDEKTQK